MADPLTLSLHDQAMIHALEVLSRPPITDRGNLDLVVDILRTVMPVVTRSNARLRPLIETADQVVAFRPNVPGYLGGLHDRARRVMNDWDSRRFADAWDRIRGGCDAAV